MKESALAFVCGGWGEVNMRAMNSIKALCTHSGVMRTSAIPVLRVECS
jgi:hypothetical protein